MQKYEYKLLLLILVKKDAGMPFANVFNNLTKNKREYRSFKMLMILPRYKWFTSYLSLLIHWRIFLKEFKYLILK